MNLNDFIAETLFNIQKGVNQAINKSISEDTRGVINPSQGNPMNGKSELIREVKFDIAVTVVEKELGTAEAGIKVMGIGGIGGNLNSQKENSHISRISFSIPLIPPVTNVENK